MAGGLLVPAVQRLRPGLLPPRFSPIYPPSTLAYVASLAVMVKLADKVSEASGVTIFERASEVEEFYLYYFVLLYLAMLARALGEKPES